LVREIPTQMLAGRRSATAFRWREKPIAHFKVLAPSLCVRCRFAWALTFELSGALPTAQPAARCPLERGVMRHFATPYNLASCFNDSIRTSAC
jgi:hypothetical protein